MASPVLVGRQDEAAALDDALSAAGHGRPSLTFVSGEAGIGKSRLVREAERRARATGALVLRGECIELGDGEFPYAPLVGALRDAVDGPLVPALERLGPSARAELARLAPALARDAAPAPSASSTQGRLFELLLALLAHAGAEAPVLLVVEDAHWADTSTRDFLAYLARNLGGERLAVVVTYRSDALRKTHPLRRLLGELIRCDVVEALTLGRLDAGELEQLLAGILGTLPPVALVQEIHARSEGNPFFAEELLASPGASGEPPESLRDALLVRVEALPGDGVVLARAMAVLGRPAGEWLLAALCGLDERRMSEALRAGLDAHLLVRQAPDAFDFRHALLREALLSDLLPGERARLHRRTAEVLRSERAGTGAELAFHWDAAGDHEAALPALVEAGQEAERLRAPTDALRHFNRALKLMETLERAGDPGLDRVELLRHAAEAARLTGDWPGAVERCRQALALLDERADPLRAACLRERLGEYLLWDDEAALACYARALELLPASEPAQRARILGAQALKLHFKQRWPEARAVAEDALDTAERAGARAEEGYARNVLGIVLAFLGDCELAEAHVREARRIAEESGGAEDVARVYVHLAEVLRLRGRTADALEIMLEGEARAAHLGMSGSFGRVMGVMAADDQMKLGRWADAESRLMRTGRLELRASSRLLHAALWARLAVLRGAPAAAERVAAARALCDAGTPPEYLTDVSHCAAELSLWLGRPGEARREVAAAFDAIGECEDPLYTPVLYWLGTRAEADAAALARPYGREEEVAAAARAATGLVQRLAALIARSSLRAAPPEAKAYLLTCRAEAARVTGAPAEDVWGAAAAAWRALGQPYPIAYARWREAEAALREDADRARARPALADAHGEATALGAKPLLAELDALARAARLDVDGAAEATPAPPARAHADLGLTRRELEVLELVAGGLTNRAISAKLFISEKTTSVHVTRILAKLDARNRTDAAGIALRLGLVDTSSTRG